ncbi:MAG: glycosyltransferase family 4 protein [Paracoccaceae bacterium]
MRILFIYRHVCPDAPPYATMLCCLGAGLAAAGHEVEIWSEQPTGGGDRPPDALPREVRDGVVVRRVARLPLWRRSAAVRWLDRLLFPARMLARSLLVRLSGRRFDIVLSATAPAVVNGVFARMSAGVLGARFLYHCQDIHPELGARAGLWRRRSVRHRILLWLDAWACAGADRLIVPSRDMRAALDARRAGGTPVEVIGNFAPDPPKRLSPRAPGGTRLTAIFAGNTGRFQDIGALADAARHLAGDPRIELVVMGDGAAFGELKRRTRDLPNVRILPRRPLPEALAVIAGADIGIVSLLPGLTAVACPSKTLTYLALGVPVVAALDRHSEYFQDIAAAGAGIVAAGPGGRELARALSGICDRRDRLPAMRRRARALYRREFSGAAATGRWLELIERAGAPR